MLKASFLGLSGRIAEDGAVSVRPAWQVREHAGVTSWYQVRLAFPDGARVDALAVVSGGGVSIEDVQAQPALSLADLAALADWIQGPLSEACGVRTEGAGERCPGGGREGRPEGADERCSEASGPAPEVVGEEGPYAGARPSVPRARPAWPRGTEGRRRVAQEYRAAQEGGADPVLAVMRATGHSRRRSLRLIARARDAGYLTPRHARR